MNTKVQIIQFNKNPNRPTDYILTSTEPTGLTFDWFRLTPTRNQNISFIGAKNCLEYWNGYKWKHITGLFKINDFQFFGDIEMETVAIEFSKESNMIEISIIKGHKPKSLATRRKRVIKFFNEQKNKG